MKQQKKPLFLLVLCVAVLGAVASASAAVNSRSASVTLKFSVIAEQRAPWDIMVANFQRTHPDVSIETSYVPFAQYGSTLLTQFQAANAPDLLVGPSGAVSPTGTYALGAQGKLLDLTGSPWVKRVLPAGRKYLLVKHHIYGFTAGYTTSGMAYNVDVFKQLGLKPPTTFGGLLNMCKTIRAAGKVPIALGAISSGAGTVSTTSNVMSSFVYAVDPNWTLERIQKKATFAGSPLWKNAINALVELRDANCYNAGAGATSILTAYGLIARGDAAMMIITQGEFTALRAINPSGNFGHMPLPSVKAADTKVQVSGSTTTLMGNKATAHPKEVKAFIDFVARPKQDRLFAKVGLFLSGDDLKKGILPDYLSAMKPYVAAGKVVFNPPAGWPRPDKGMFTPFLTTEISGLFTGQRTSEQILQNLDTLWDKP
jgi:raffinose/stachyose/melibiose transport system substrate-binding protein